MQPTVKHSAWRGIMAAASFVVSFLLTHFASELNITLAQILAHYPEVANITLGAIIMAVWHFVESKLDYTPQA